MERETVRLLLVEDNPHDVEIVRRMLGGYERVKFEVASAGSTEEGEEALNDKPFDLVLLDYKLPGEDGLGFLRRLQNSGDLPPIIMLTARGDERVAVKAMQSGAYDYFPKSAITSEVLGRAIHQALEKHRLVDQLDGAEQVIFRLAAVAEARDRTTRNHLHRMAHYATQVGRAMRLDKQQLTLLRYGAILHDVGKIAVSEETLCKPDSLTDAQWTEVYLHPIMGEKICAPLRHTHELGPIIRHHHERWDGKGYVGGLAGEEIPFLARVVSVIDAFDAMLSDRPYRKALPLDETTRRLSDGAGTQWDPYITQEFLDLVQHEGLRVGQNEAKPSRCDASLG
jgi:putative two-component system response regulator